MKYRAHGKNVDSKTCLLALLSLEVPSSRVPVCPPCSVAAELSVCRMHELGHTPRGVELGMAGAGQQTQTIKYKGGENSGSHL